MQWRARGVMAVTVAALLALGCNGDGASNDGSAQCAAVVEVCNGTDDDCDGSVDELASITCGVGACEVTVPGCANGGVATCVPHAPSVAEACDGTDDDCDGAVDEGCECSGGAERSCYEGPPATAGVGVCHAGSQRCASGRWGECSGAAVPSEESCNTLDDDCDGAIDEGACRWSGVKRLVSPAREALVDLAIDPLGSVHAAITSGDWTVPWETPNLDVLLAGYDVAGMPLPVHTFPTQRSARMERVAATRDSEGSTYVSLSSWKWSPAELFKLDATGRLLWSLTLLQSNMPVPAAEPSLAVDGADVVHVTVFTEAGWVLRKYDRDGRLVATVPLPPLRTPRSMALGPDGDIHIAGSAQQPDVSDIAFVAKLRPDGTPAWEVLISDRSSSAYGLAVGPSGMVSVVGWEHGPSSTDPTFLVCYTSAGEAVWERRFPRGSEDAPGAVLAAGPGDHVWSAGVTGDYPSHRAHVSRYDSSGALVWSVDLGEASTTWMIGDLVVDAAGDAYVGGETRFPEASEGDYDVFVAKISAAGVLQ